MQNIWVVDGSRSHNLLLHKQMLYQLSYDHHAQYFYNTKAGSALRNLVFGILFRNPLEMILKTRESKEKRGEAVHIR